MGFEPDLQESRADLTRMAYKALGSEMYAGTSGVGLFLAQLYGVTGHNNVRKTAMGAYPAGIGDGRPRPSPNRNIGVLRVSPVEAAAGRC
jgi:hypothetical protein